MTPDLPTRARKAFEDAIDASSPAIRDEGEALDFALAAVIAVVQEDRTRALALVASPNRATYDKDGLDAVRIARKALDCPHFNPEANDAC